MIHVLKRLALLGLALAAGTKAEEFIPFSGIAFTSELGFARESMPYTFSLIGNFDTDTGRAFFKSLSLAADGKTLKNGDALSSQKENSLDRGQALAIALAIENEKMNETLLNPTEYQLAFNLDAKILAFNFSEKSIVSSHPIRLTLVNSLPRKPTQKDRQQLARIMFFGDPDKRWFDDLAEAYLIQNFLKTIGEIEIRPAWRSQIRIKTIGLSPLTEKILKEHDQENDYIRQLIASSLSSSLSTRLGIPVLPYIKSDAIQNSMTLKFMETDLMNFRIPEANFHLDVRVRGFGSKTLKETARTRVVSYISGVEVEVTDKDFEVVRMSHKFQAGNVKRLSVNMENDLWHEYEQSILALLDQIVSQVEKPDKKWAEEHAAGNAKARDIVKTFKNVKTKVIDQIRG